MNPVVHFELPYENRERAAEFYSAVFGWSTQFLGPEMGDYILATTVTSDVKPGSPAGAINGGMFPKKPDWPLQYPSIVIAVSNVNVAMAAIERAGGQVLGEPHNIPNYGQYVSFIDTEGNRNSILQPI